MLTEKDLTKLAGVDPRLVSVIGAAAAITSVPFFVIEGRRSKERQAMLYAAGKSQSLNGRHCLGEAVDVCALVNGKADWTWSNYEKIARAVKIAADQLDIKIEWGGDWRTFKDGVHFQLKK